MIDPQPAAPTGGKGKPLRIYADTSVIGGCLDEEFAEHSRRLMDGARAGRFTILVSDVVIDELGDAPEAVQAILPSLPLLAIERVAITLEVVQLRNAYVRAGVVGESSIDDATHVAAATLAGADAIASWNFKHIVRLDRIKGYNQVNAALGYAALTILSPREIIGEPENPAEHPTQEDV